MIGRKSLKNYQSNNKTETRGITTHIRRRIQMKQNNNNNNSR